MHFEHHADEDDVIIELSQMPKYSESRGKTGAPRLVLEGTDVPAALEQKLDTTAFGGVVSGVSTYGDAGHRLVTLDVESEAPVDTRISRRGTALVWSMFKPGSLPASVTGVGLDGGAARKGKTLHVEDQIHDIPSVTTDYRSGKRAPAEHTVSGADAAAFTPAIAGQAENAAAAAAGAAAGSKYDGQRMNLDLKDADIHNILRLLADVGHVNIVTADDVTGTMTIRMRNVPWDQALDVVLQAKGLGMVRAGNLIRVAPMAQLQKERELRARAAEAGVRAHAARDAPHPGELRAAPTSSRRAPRSSSRRAAPSPSTNARTCSSRATSPGNLNHIEELIRSLDTQTPQVLIEARIVEATSKYLRDVGIQWGGDATFSAATGNPTGIAFPSSITVVRRQLRQQHADRRSVALHAKRRDAELRGQPPGRRRHRNRRCARHHASGRSTTTST